MEHIQLLRLPQALATLKMSRSTFYRQIQQGLLPTSVSLGARSVCWLQHELEAILTARICGYSEGEIMTLVKDIIQERRNLMEKA